MRNRPNYLCALGFVLVVTGCGSDPGPAPNNAGGSGGGGDGGGSAVAGTGGGAGSAGSGVAGTGGSGVAGTGGSGGTGGSSGGQTCADLACVSPATCDDTGATPVCVCPAGFSIDGGNKCKADDGTACAADADCVNAHCVGSVCCASACTTPGACHVAAGATCTGGATCVYPTETDGAVCDDGDLCSATETCQAGVCTMATALDCDDLNDCTADGCVPATGCAHDGTGITTAGCKADDNCNTSFACQGDAAGSCVAANITDCSGATDTCGTGYCDLADGACKKTPINEGNGCDDGAPCTPSDTCVSGTCTAGTPKDCTSLDSACSTGYCDAADGACKASAKNEGGGCDDGDLCTLTDICTSGTCAGTAKDCTNLDDDCNAGECDSADGTCKPTPINLGASCSDGDFCTTGETCTAQGACTGGGAVVCDDSDPCTDVTCDPGKGCVTANNTDACDDGNPCTDGDVCANGTCTPTTPHDCSDGNPCTDDGCNPLAASPNQCTHANNTATCVDTSSCTTTSQCSGGTCVGGPADACGPNSTACAPGTPNTCTCAADYHDNGAGSCAPNTDECIGDPCDANAACLDPSLALGDYTCTCDTGYTGDGKKSGTGCTDIDECAGDPCGNGTCQEGAPGTYSCDCDPGYWEVQGTCICDLNGTYAMQITAVTEWTNINGVEDATGANRPVVQSWALRKHTYTTSGDLSVETIACGGTAADVCGTGVNLPPFISIPAEAYAQFFPITIWGGATMPKETIPSPVGDLANIPAMHIPGILDGDAFTTPMSAALFGIKLTDSLGAWPATRYNVGAAAANQTNGAVWVNHDGDDKDGVTSYSVPLGGIAVDGNFPDPMTAYPATSPVCPRTNPSAPDLAYNYWIGFDGLTQRRVRRFHVASRTRGFFDGELKTCGYIDGSVKGPGTNNQMLNEARIAGCVRSSGVGETDCENGLVDFYDTQSQSNTRVVSATFVMKRVSNATTCAQARALNYTTQVP